jgi:hypothetical protein
MSFNKTIVFSAVVLAVASASALAANMPAQTATVAHGSIPAAPAQVQPADAQPAPLPTTGDASRLTLGEIDAAARGKVLKELRGDTASGPFVNQIPAPMVNQMPPMPPTLVGGRMIPAPAEPPHSAAQVGGVEIVGVVADGHSVRVLYPFNGAIYSAALGEKMLNGITAKKVRGLNVMVSNGRREWQVPVSTPVADDLDSGLQSQSH